MTANGEVRVGDAERRNVDTLLQQACGDGLLSLSEYDERSAAVWAARTRGELALVTDDLPAILPAAQGVSAPEPVAHGTNRWGVAVFGEERMTGPVLGNQKLHSIAVMGHGVVDLRRDDLPPKVTVTATAVMGNVEVLVPEGARVEANGFSVMGSREVNVAPPLPGAPLIRIHAMSLMGSVEIKHKKLSRKDGRREGMTRSLGDAAVAHRDRSLDRHGEHRNRRVGLLGVAVAVLVVGGSAAALSGDSVSAFGSNVVNVPTGQTSVHVASFFGSTKVVLPPNTCAVLSGTHIFGSSEVKHSAGAQQIDQCGPTSTTVRIRGDGAFGSIEVIPRDYKKVHDGNDN